MSVPEWLGWATTFLGSLGLMNYLMAGLVITLAVTTVRLLFGRGD